MHGPGRGFRPGSAWPLGRLLYQAECNPIAARLKEAYSHRWAAIGRNCGRPKQHTNTEWPGLTLLIVLHVSYFTTVRQSEEL
jgi:hypothetical protein